MKNTIRRTLNTLPAIFKYLFVGAIVLGISFLCPNHVNFKYQFDQGVQWPYEDLYAPFGFGIKKTPAEQEEELKLLEASFSPYYQLDPEVADQQKRQFADDFENRLKKGEELFQDVLKRPGVYKRFGLELIQNIYNQGLIELNKNHEGKGDNFVINVLKGNVAKKQTLGNIPSLKNIENRLADSLLYSGLKEAEFLLPLLENTFRANIIYNDELTQRFKNEELEARTTTRGAVQKGDLIVKEGGLITEEVYQKLLSFKEQYKEEVTVQNSYWGVFSGYLVLTSLVAVIFLLYLQFNEPEVFNRLSNLLFTFTWVVVYAYLVYAVERIDLLSSYMIPFCIAPIVIKNFYNERLAFFTHVAIILISSYQSALGYEFAFLQITAGIVAVLTNTETRFWSKFFISIFFIFLTYLVGYTGLSLIQEGDILGIDSKVYLFLFLNAIFMLLAYPLVPLFEKLFGFTSAITLVELSDLNLPLLKELSIKAPGTLQHSLQVSNLAEAAARRVGANPLMVKVAALYHDIGKLKQPEFFIENQSGKNPHDELGDAMESARIIIGHVTEGERLAKKHRLPAVLQNFIRTHHGTTKVAYFFRKYQEENDDIAFDESLFCYPGPKPRTKEETILMMADSLEAASKSLKNPTGRDIDNLVNGIVGGKISNGQFEFSELTFEELEICKDVFRKLLRSINHVRVEYPKEA